MRIAQVAPLYEAVPPHAYGATERVVSYLTKELVRRGHEVTLFASADSRTAAELAPVCPAACGAPRTSGTRSRTTSASSSWSPGMPAAST